MFLHFEYPWFLLLLLPVVGVFFLLQYVFPKTTHLYVASTNFASPLEKGFRYYLLKYYPFLFYLSIALLVFAIARPKSIMDKNIITLEGLQMMIVLDVSRSMLLEDLQPNRLEVAKKVAIDFIKNRETDQIGMLTFAEHSFLQCPLTLDYNILNSLIREIEVGAIFEGNATAIGVALAGALNRLKEVKTKLSNKIIILLTDGENNYGEVDPFISAKIAKSLGVRVYTVGVGKQGIINIPIQTPLGKIYKKVHSQIDEELLMKIARSTEGKYFRADDASSLEKVFEEISKLEKEKINVDDYQNYRELFLFFLTLSFGFFLLYYFLKHTYCKTFP